MEPLADVDLVQCVLFSLLTKVNPDHVVFIPLGRHKNILVTVVHMRGTLDTLK